MSHVFISYSRRDADFVRRLHGALDARGHEAWVDWQEIPPSDEWLTTIRTAIDGAEALVFVITPDSIASEICNVELKHAIAQNKRLIPVLRREPETAVPAALGKINYIFARDGDPFEEAVEALVSAIETDLDWVRAHTRLLVRATEWERAGRDSSFTLRGRDLTAFEDWAAKAPDKEPKPTALQSEYLLISRRGVTRRQRITWASISVGLAIAAILGTVAWFQSQERDRQQQIAGARQLLSRAEALREVPDLETGAYRMHSESVRVAVSALATLDRVGEATIDAELALRKSRARLRNWIRLKPDNVGIRAVAFDPAARFVALAQSDQSFSVWDVAKRERVGQCKSPHTVAYDNSAITLSPDGHRVAVYTDIGSPGERGGHVLVYDLPACTELLSVMVSQTDRSALRRMRLTVDGQQLIVLSNAGFDVWNLADGTSRPLNRERSVSDFAVDPERRLLATAELVEADEGTRHTIAVRKLDTLEVVAATEVSKRPHFKGWIKESLFTTRDRFELRDDELVGHPFPRIRSAKTAISPNGTQYAAIRHNTVPGETTPIGIIEIRDLDTGEVTAQYERQGTFRDLAFSPDGRSLVSVDDQNVEIGIWHFAASGGYARLQSDRSLTSIEFSEPGDRLIGVTKSDPVVWALPPEGSGEAPETASQPARADGEAAASSGPGSSTPNVVGKDVLAMTSSTSGQRAVIVGTQQTRGGIVRRLELWQGDTKLHEVWLEPVLDPVLETFLLFTGQDRFLVTGDRNGLQVRDAATLDVVASLFHSDVILVGVQADGMLAATLGRNDTIRVWNIADGTEVTRFTAERPARALAISNDGRWLAALGVENEVDLWALTPSDLIAGTCFWLDKPCP